MDLVPRPNSKDEDHPIACMEGNGLLFSARPVLFGFRVSATITYPGALSPDFYSIDYCAANQWPFLPQLYLVLLSIVKAMPEGLSRSQVAEIMPTYTIRPINKDPNCWSELVGFAAKDVNSLEWAINFKDYFYEDFRRWLLENEHLLKGKLLPILEH